MQIIKDFINLLRALFGLFTDAQFEALCKEYGEYDNFDTQKYKSVKKVLKTFFAHNTPTSRQLKAIYNYDENLKWLYLNSISAKRVLTDEEQMYLATKMIFGLIYRFPQPLNDKALTALFESGNVHRISAYVKSFALPEQFELKLIQCYAKHQTSEVKENKAGNPYKFVLYTYLSNPIHSRHLSAKVQTELLQKVWEEDLWEALCSTLNMRENILTDRTVYKLILRKYHRALKSLLFHSFISSVEMQRHLYTKMPELRWILEISKVRHALRKMEVQTKTMMGVEVPNCREEALIRQYYDAEYKRTFVENCTKVKLDMQTATPYFCAWAADKYPDLGQEAYCCLRKFSSKYSQLYRKYYNI